MRERHVSILNHVLWAIVPAGVFALALVYGSLFLRLQQEGERLGENLVESTGMALVGGLDQRSRLIVQFLEDAAQKTETPQDVRDLRAKIERLTKAVAGISAIYQLDPSKIITHRLYGGKDEDLGAELTTSHPLVTLSPTQSVSTMKTTHDSKVPFFRWFQRKGDQSWIILDWDLLDIKSLCEAGNAASKNLTIGLISLQGFRRYFGCSSEEASTLDLALSGKSDPGSRLTWIRTHAGPTALFWQKAAHLPVTVVTMAPPLQRPLGRDFDLLFLGFLATGLGLGWLLAQILATRLQRSLRPLEEAMVQVGNGHLGVALADDGAAEIVRVKRTFNHMAKSVHYSYEKARSVTKMALALAGARHVMDLVMKATELACGECACQMAWFEVIRDPHGHPLIPASSWLWRRSETRTEPKKDVENFALDQGSGLQDLSFPIRAGTVTIGRLHLYVREDQEDSKVDLAQALVSTIERALAQTLGVQKAVVVQVAAEASEAIFRANTEVSTLSLDADYRVTAHLDSGDALSRRFFHTMVHPKDGSLCLVMGVSLGPGSGSPSQGYLESADVVMPLLFQGALKNMGHQLREGHPQGMSDWSAWIRQSLAQIAADVRGHRWLFSTFFYHPRERSIVYHRAHNGFGPLIIKANRAAATGAALLETHPAERNVIISIDDLLVIYMPPVLGWSEESLSPYLNILRRHLAKVSKETTSDSLCAQIESLSDYYGTSQKSRADAFFWSLELLPRASESKSDHVQSAS